MSAADLVRAAGGVVWRRTHDHDIEIVLVHRPTYDDWTLPKGKRSRRETDEQAALREVEEETGLRCHLGPELSSTRYTDAKGRPKIVRYWAMGVDRQQAWSPNHEIDDWKWVVESEAEKILTYPRDRTVVRSLRDVLNKR